MLLFSLGAVLAAVVLYALLIPSQSHLISDEGRIARILAGGLILLGAAVGYPYRLSEGSLAAVGIQIMVTLAGVFLLFEGVKGWCALRALGIPTPF